MFDMLASAMIIGVWIPSYQFRSGCGCSLVSRKVNTTSTLEK